MVRTGWDIIVITRTRHGRNTILPIAQIPYELHLRLANSHAHKRRRRAWAKSLVVNTGFVVVYSLWSASV